MEGPPTDKLAGLLAAVASVGARTACAGGGAGVGVAGRGDGGTLGDFGGFDGGSARGNPAAESVGVPSGTSPPPAEAAGDPALSRPCETDESLVSDPDGGFGRHADANFSAIQSFLWQRQPAGPETLVTTVATTAAADCELGADQTVKEFLETWVGRFAPLARRYQRPREVEILHSPYLPLSPFDAPVSRKPKTPPRVVSASKTRAESETRLFFATVPDVRCWFTLVRVIFPARTAFLRQTRRCITY
ncbi:MAG: hypothetical protein BJ554DRAFT_2329 [Olpidium bornovanus]|uniref:Uncharacterized protein n=1 Tax=Olpidium bornovanus TaxID=278681 RepID=A0A8H8DGQ7_9FUNG|nr:MAG: hypothetical protein BJ554DRAFT_2329 [Olpidium bornovanus]